MTDTVCVPMEPTEAMIEASNRAGMAFAGGDLSDADMTRLVWSAMLAASPQGQSSSGDWIKHDGGPNPVPGKTVEGQYPGETRVFHGPSEGVVWGRGVIYRVTEGVKP